MTSPLKLLLVTGRRIAGADAVAVDSESTHSLGLSGARTGQPLSRLCVRTSVLSESVAGAWPIAFRSFVPTATDAWLAKPLSMPELLKTVRDLLAAAGRTLTRVPSALNCCTGAP
jgi:hypothetical protein